MTPSTYFLLGTSCSSSASWEREILLVPIFRSPDKTPPLLSNLVFKFFVSVINFESVMMMISALPLGRSVMTPVVESQCHLNLGSEMRDDDEVVSRCLPQQATVC